jgi:outer membrane protein
LAQGCSKKDPSIIFYTPQLANTNIELHHEAFINGVADNQDLILGENDLNENQARYFNELLDLMLNKIEGQGVIGSFNRQAGPN